MKYLSENRIQDERGKVWFVTRVVENEYSRSGEYIMSSEKSKLEVIAYLPKLEDWQGFSDLEKWEKILTSERKLISFKRIDIKKEPFERIVNIIF
ncbi:MULTISPECIES: hypothetical protein [unclassified Enterococcus]|uniref:hypothetical protein n=1 Tax=unclassified Enterococcus TaxID=2608891 RepID=UPI001552A053|nr:MULTISPECIES: hypothetical protein [unclassified Enterococcus]MBS7578300.1 hypothetical protein [Enterococcus sp. MMGLQ5-2]MBS7585489.1 hypothetical protein [Enterococcus sp. MMGLQ5-1]NPD13346.1 hypothetical protein [Enterococcus sp. MMGLQ5-1]NPD38131.1 hypothetical protein [Enterococcus sp. MMGLQ5-2]